jgi:hypothetical protein
MTAPLSGNRTFTMRPGARAAMLCLLVLAALAALPRAARAQVRNVTAENRAVLDETILRMRQVELMRVSRGRVKSNPVIQPHFTIYQSVLQDRELLLERQVKDYAAALGGMQRAREDFAAFTATPLGVLTTDLFYQKLIDTYDLTDDLEKTLTLWDVWTALHLSGYRMQAMPVTFRLALNTGHWINSHFQGAPPQDVQDRFLALCREDIQPTNVFEEQEQVDALSLHWSEFFAQVTTGRQASPDPGAVSPQTTEDGETVQ